MPIRGEGEGLVDDDGADQAGSSRQAPERLVYILHPNCAIEEV